MSVRLSRLVWEGGPTKRAERHLRFVLLAIADNADDAGKAWPSISLLCRKTLFSKRRVLDAIEDLEKGGWLQVERAIGKGSHYQVDMTKLEDSKSLGRRPAASQLADGNQCSDSTGATSEPVQSTALTGAIYDNPPDPLLGRIVIEQSYTLTPPETPTKTRKAAKPTVPDAAVEEIYRQYPRHVKRPEAKRAIGEAILRVAKADGISQDEAAQKLLSRVGNYSAYVKRVGMEMQYCPYPATWFNGERYDDDDCLGRGASNTGTPKYTDPATLYSGPEYQDGRRLA